MSTLHIPFRHDHVGSFLRPARLKDARIRYEAGSISAEQLKQIEDEEIAALEQQLETCREAQTACGSDYVRLQELTQEQERLSAQLDERMERWVYLNDLKERIDAQEK